MDGIVRFRMEAMQAFAIRSPLAQAVIDVRAELADAKERDWRRAARLGEKPRLDSRRVATR